jgi:hypothetical protein
MLIERTAGDETGLFLFLNTHRRGATYLAQHNQKPMEAAWLAETAAPVEMAELSLDDDRGGSRQDPRAVHIVRDTPDAAVNHVKMSDSSRHPTTGFSMQNNDDGLAIHLAYRHLPGYVPTVVVPEVRRVVQPAGKFIRYPQPSVISDQFTESNPIAPIETLDV